MPQRSSFARLIRRLPSLGRSLRPSLLGALANNGGPTLTRMPQPTSLAIDGGNAAGCRDQANNLLTTDQRGSVRPIDGDGLGGAVCDIGAVEAPAGLRVFVPKTMRGE